jgi:hypothetical protein
VLEDSTSMTTVIELHCCGRVAWVEVPQEELRGLCKLWSLNFWNTSCEIFEECFEISGRFVVVVWLPLVNPCVYND